jgi:hypothetical protein
VQEITEVLPHPEATGPDEEPKVGDIMTSAYMLDNEFGAGSFKEFLKPLASHLGLSNVREISTNSKGMDLIVVVKRTWNKEKERFYGNVKQVAVL